MPLFSSIVTAHKRTKPNGKPGGFFETRLGALCAWSSMAPDISTRSEKGLWVCIIHVAGTVMVEAACQKKKESIEEACSMLVSMIKEDVMEAAPTRDGRMDDAR
jgi:hypothetical protein